MHEFKVTKRSLTSTKAKQLRKQGLMPMALVGRDNETVALQAPLDGLTQAIRHADRHGRLSVHIEGEDGPRQAMIKHIDQDGLRQELIHVTLQEVSNSDHVRVDVPVVPVGEIDEGSGVTLTHVTDHLKLAGKLEDMPNRIEVDVSSIVVGGHIEAQEIPLPPGVTLLTSPNATVFSLAVNRGVAELPSEESPVEE